MSQQMLVSQSEFAAALIRDAPDYGVSLHAGHLTALTAYYAILQRWNLRLHLVAPSAPAEFARRHILESLFASSAIRENSTMVDVGSGGGLPALPLLIFRSDLRATLIEANRKKAVFLREALTAVGCATQAEVVSARFEEVPAPRADALTCRALDRFTGLLPQLLAWSKCTNTLLLFGGKDLRAQLPDDVFIVSALLIPHSERRFLFVLQRHSS
jgi:16S rRNA (guanine527-N7)-methyltransferase